MDKYLLVVLIVLVVGMGFAIMKDPRDPLRLELFYGQLAGALVIIAYSTIKNRKNQNKVNRRRR